MCVIWHREKGAKPLPTDTLRKMHTKNDDGCGVMFHNGEQVIRYRGMWSFNQLRKVVRRLECNDTEFCLHLRLCTHGGVRHENCHPFYIGDGAFVMHNGVLDLGKMEFRKDRSDTWHFARGLWSLEAGRTLADHPKAAEILEKFHGYSNRLCIMFASGKVIRTGSWSLLEKGHNMSNLNFQNTYSKGGCNNWYYHGTYELDDSKGRSRGATKTEVAKSSVVTNTSEARWWYEEDYNKIIEAEEAAAEKAAKEKAAEDDTLLTTDEEERLLEAAAKSEQDFNQTELSTEFIQ